jgi:hypothetical protein
LRVVVSRHVLEGYKVKEMGYYLEDYQALGQEVFMAVSGRAS